MTLPLPDLDDKTYDELFERARDRIPVDADTWTDYNVHDPGITILELLAWITEADIYRLDQVTDAHRRQFLRLLGVTPRPPQPATATLLVTPPAGTSGFTIPAGTELTVARTRKPTLAFSTVRSMSVTQAALAVIIGDHAGGQTDHTTANNTPGVSFQPFGPEANPGSTLYLGFDGDPFDGVSTLDLTVQFHEADIPAPAEHGLEAVDFDPTVDRTWEYCTDYERWYESASWAPLMVFEDTTTRFYESGTVRLNQPPDWLGAPAAASLNVLDQDRELVWLRCQLETPTDGGAGHEVSPQFDEICLNTVTARHEQRRTDELLTNIAGGQVTTAEPDQTFGFANAPLLGAEDPAQADVAIVVGVGDTAGVLDTAWTPIDDFAASGPDDTHFTVDHTAGTITFGDGIRGKIPAPGQRVMAQRYRHGGGIEGNVIPGGHWQVQERALELTGGYLFASGNQPEQMRGAVVVGDLDGPLGADVVEWLAPARGEPTPHDARGESTVRITVGTADDETAPRFTPAAVQVDPGTTVEFEWLSGGHTIDLVAAPADSSWQGVTAGLDPGATVTHTFEAPVDLSAMTVSQAGRATGGREAETVDEALLRLQRDRQTVYRAVTAADYATLATQTPGLRFGRAAAFVDPTPSGPECARHGTIQVIVVPFSTQERPDPSGGFLEAVACHLERHRLVTDRPVVKPPEYVGIGVDVEVSLEPGVAVAERAAAIDEQLQTFLHPLSGYEGSGWPFGRAVYQAELYEVVEGVTGVDCVHDIDIRATGSTARLVDDAVEIGPQTLVYSLDHEVGVRPTRPNCGPGGGR